MGGKVGRKAQVALFVLLGVILVIGVVLAIYVINKQEISTSTTTNPAELYAGNPELAAEAMRMQERADRCLEEVSEDALEIFSEEGSAVGSLAEAQEIIEEEISLSFPGCFYLFNTNELLINQETPPSIAIGFSNTGMSVTAEYSVQGEYEGQTYGLSDYQASVTTRFRPLLERGLGLRSMLESGPSPTGSSGVGGPDVPLGEEFIDENCYVDLYAYQDQGIYADIDQYADGSFTALFYDYENLNDEGMPGTVAVDLPACTPADTSDETVQILESTMVTCQVNQECLITLGASFPEEFNIISTLYVNPLTLEIDTAETEPGVYTAVAVAYENGEEVLQPIIIEVAGGPIQ